MNINWDDLKDGDRSFEKIANEYVKFRWKEIDWHPTKQTHDGNRDGEALVYVFQGSKKLETHWWMEAKYSTRKAKLSRYRIDPTIVSALIDGMVKKIIFVTNVDISAKDMNDIRIALLNGGRCDEVVFCSKLQLEYWIAVTPNIYKSFFNQTIPFRQISVPELYVVEGLTFYDVSGKHCYFKEPLKRIFPGHKYSVFFKIFAREKTAIHIVKPSNLRGLSISGNKTIELDQGENSVSLNIDIKPNFRSINGLIFLTIQGYNLQISSTLSVSSSHETIGKLCLPTQNDLVRDIFKNYRRVQKGNELFCCGIFGETGVGKTYIIKELIEKIHYENKDVFFYSFSEKRTLNYHILIYLTMFLIFPYLPYQQLDADYLIKIGKAVSYINPEFLQMVINVENINKTEDIDGFSNNMRAVITSNRILPDNMSMNGRIIVLEDIFKLDDLGLDYLLELMDEINLKKLPVFLLFTSYPCIKRKKAYLEYKLRYPVVEYECELTFEDVYMAAKQSAGLDGMEDYIKSFKSNVFELFAFIRFLNQDDTLTDGKSFLASYRLFLHSRMLEKTILDQFTNFFKNTPEGKQYCDKVYWSSTPVNYSAIPENIADRLFAARLIRSDEENNIKPYHDLYVSYYRKQYKDALESLDDIEPDSMEEYRLRIGHSIDRDELHRISYYIQDLIDSQKYYSVLYILEDIFQESNLEPIVARMGEKLFYHLYINYALAAHQQSTSADCKRIFESIYEDVYSSHDSNMILIAIKCQWELYMIQFENLQYNMAKKTRETILGLINKMNSIDHEVENKERDYYVRRSGMQNIVIDADSGKGLSYKEFETVYKEFKTGTVPYIAESFRARYAVVIAQSDPERCIELLNKGKAAIKDTYGTDDKHYQWCEFYYEFYSLIYYKDENHFPKMLDAAECLRKNQSGNYRKKLFAIATLYYSKGDIVEGNKLLLKNELYSTGLRNRYQAFYNEAYAIYSLQTGDTNAAIQALDTAISVFCDLPSYAIIPKHNKKVVNDGAYSESRIQFLFGDKMEYDVYYLDPRSAW